ncbi:hypothetical protein [Aquabacterium sp.]|uniref:hypothetical protein n=1 Tax=Aquabacterium sp. TaxID=1872578 RepID=UPI00378328DA
MKPAHPSSVHRRKPRGATRAIGETPVEARDDGEVLLELPDGWYWVAPDGHQQFGPFDSAELARADRARGSVEAVEGASALLQTERVAGIAERADPEVDAPLEDPESPAS